MRFAAIRHTGARLAITAGLAGLLFFAGTVPTFADTQSDLATAQSQLAQIGRQYQQLQNDLQRAAQELESTKGEIESTSQKLAAAQDNLSSSTSLDYKTGGAKLSAVILGATNFNDLISRVFYMNKLSDAKAETIRDVKELKEQLEQQESDQENRLNATQEQVDAAAANQQQAQALVNSLSAEVKAELEAQAAQDAALAAGLQSSDDATNAPAVGNVSGSTDADIDSSNMQDTEKTEDAASGKENAGQDAPAAAPSPSPAPEQPTEQKPEQKPAAQQPAPSKPSLPQHPTGSSPIAIALQYQGAPYVYGGKSPSAGGFDCSGLVYFAYKQCGISLPGNSDAQMSYIKSNGFFTTDVNQLSYSDLVFFPGHVGFYVGNGQIYGARRPGTSASTTLMKYFGTFLGGGHL